MTKLKYDEVLLIGGPHDGKFIEAVRGAPQIVVRSAIGPKVLWPELTDELTKNATVYDRHPFKSPDGRVHVVYACDGVDVFARLIEGYKP
jgi:hypothetical protein